MIMHQLKISNGGIYKIFINGEATPQRAFETLEKQEKIWSAHGCNNFFFHAPPKLPILQYKSEKAKEKANWKCGFNSGYERL
jgi:hypothetical protein